MKYIFDKKHITIDDLSQRFRNSSNDINEVHKKNINDFIDEQLNCVYVCFMNVNKIEKKLLLKKNYFEKSQRIARYLIILT